jgi:hypothetical protein
MVYNASVGNDFSESFDRSQAVEALSDLKLERGKLNFCEGMVGDRRGGYTEMNSQDKR